MSDEQPDWWREPSEGDLHTEYLDWIGGHATPTEQARILRERIRSARTRGDPRCPACHGRQRRHCPACAGIGYREPTLRPTTTTEDLVAQDIATTRRCKPRKQRVAA